MLNHRHAIKSYKRQIFRRQKKKPDIEGVKILDVRFRSHKTEVQPVRRMEQVGFRYGRSTVDRSRRAFDAGGRP